MLSICLTANPAFGPSWLEYFHHVLYWYLRVDWNRVLHSLCFHLATKEGGVWILWIDYLCVREVEGVEYRVVWGAKKVGEKGRGGDGK